MTQDRKSLDVAMKMISPSPGNNVAEKAATTHYTISPANRYCKSFKDKQQVGSARTLGTIAQNNSVTGPKNYLSQLINDRS